LRIGYVFIHIFTIAVERKRNPDLIDKPVIVGGYPYERKPVIAASAECLEAGVQVGMPLRQAHLLCPEAVFLAADLDTYNSTGQDFLAALDYFSPAVESDAPGAAYLDAEGLTLLFGEERELGQRIIATIRKQLGMNARVVFGPGKFVAKVAASFPERMPAVAIVKNKESMTFLSGLSIDCLRLGETSCERLRMLGIRTIGQFMRLPAQSLMERLGPDAVAARKAIAEEDKDVVMPRAMPSSLERSVALDYPIVSMGGFSLVARDLVAFLGAELRCRYQACQTVALHVEFENGRTREDSIQLKEPTDSEKDLLAALERLAYRTSKACPPKSPRQGTSPGPTTDGVSGVSKTCIAHTSEVIDGGIVAMKIILGGLVRPVFQQMGFFEAQRRRRAHLDRALDEIKDRFGDLSLSKFHTHLV